MLIVCTYGGSDTSQQGNPHGWFLVSASMADVVSRPKGTLNPFSRQILFTTHGTYFSFQFGDMLVFHEVEY